MTTEDYDTLSQAIDAMRRAGYTEDFNLANDCIVSSSGACRLSPSDFQIDRVFRFEGPTDPGDEAVLYAVSSTRGKEKGLLVNGYGLYSDSVSNALVARLSVGKR